jgi:hypothetical protein
MYVRELSVTPVGYFTGAIENTGTILHGENEDDFPKVSFTLDGI